MLTRRVSAARRAGEILYRYYCYYGASGHDGSRYDGHTATPAVVAVRDDHTRVTQAPPAAGLAATTSRGWRLKRIPRAHGINVCGQAARIT